MFRDYESLVLRDYRRKMLANTLSARLSHPTSAKLREECITVLNRRTYNKKDDRTLMDFFDLAGDAKISEQIIQQFDPDKFKPLVNFLKNHTSTTETKNVELLAWLIDFEDRPYVFGRKYDQLNPDILEFTGGQMQGHGGNREMIPPERPDNSGERKEVIPQEVDSGKPYPKLKSFTLIASIIILISATGLIYWLWNNKSTLAGQQKCMYWTGDHYQQIPCNRQKFGDTMLIAFDSVRFYNFKKITNPDTINRTAIGRVWYIKIDNKLEYYTADGYHPINPRLRLKPITAFIIDKYLKRDKD